MKPKAMSLRADLEGRTCPACEEHIGTIPCDECGETYGRECIEGGLCPRCRSCSWCHSEPIDPDYAPCCGPEHVKKLAKAEADDQKMQAWKDRP